MEKKFTIGERVKEIREAKGLSGKDLASLINKVPSYVSEIENGKKNPTLDTLELIAKALDVGIGYLLSREKRYDSDFLNLLEITKQHGSKSELQRLIWLFNVGIIFETQRNQNALEQKVKLLQKYEQVITEQKPVLEIKNELAAIDKTIAETQSHIQSISPCLMEQLETSNNI